MYTPPKSKHIPQATIKRLATYVQVLESLQRDNIDLVASRPLAEACGVQGSQVRKDLAYFGEFGIRGVGYQVKNLILAITTSLGVDHEWPMVLLGVGNLGRAIINHIGFHAHGFRIQAIFDCDPEKIGKTAHGFEILPPEALAPIVAMHKIEIGIVTTKPNSAQLAADTLVSAGISAILNFSPARIKVPESIHVEYVDFFRQLYSLVFDIVRDKTSVWDDNDS
ncbi:MAG: redox-sensing transcriptional repressor Rex [Desulfovibrionaceae bacterium]|nr:redox-sensing transcriptional repressor Rex [Desulfovibrionaceae bacterium]